MGADEEGTHERLKAHLRELVTDETLQLRNRSFADSLLEESGFEYLVPR
jgi:hypothetical protein